jgi:HJR/Mrr/RecB family endonuclease
MNIEIKKGIGKANELLRKIRNYQKIFSKICNSCFSWMDGLKYEMFVRDYFVKLGCNTKITKASGDHGVDVVVEVGDIKIAVQCKHYNSKVSNSAVQQVYSAKDFFDCNIAAVVSNNFFTNQAKQLAEKLGVYLLHHQDLEEFISKIYEIKNK